VTPFALFIAILSALIWLYLLVARGSFFYLRPYDDDLAVHTAPSKWPSVVAIVPARDEAETIGRSVHSLLEQNYAGEFSVIVVDDHSEDSTAAIAREVAAQRNATGRVRILSASALPARWTGKLWALNEGVRSASTSAAYLWLTDADIIHAPDALTRLVSRAESERLALTSLMVQLRAETLAERFTIPAFLFFFLKLYPPKWSASSKARTAGAAGGCILLQTATLDRIGGFESIRGEVIDDCALARAVKRSGGKIWMGITRKSLSLRAYHTLREVRDMIARTAFTQLRYSPLFFLATLLGLALTYLAPVALLFVTDTQTRTISLATWLVMASLFLPTVRFYRVNPLWAPLLSATAAFYAYATLLSVIRYYSHRGAHWKGRSQAAR
jgi:hopene-associated glycosyltransferase HpnB